MKTDIDSQPTENDEIVVKAIIARIPIVKGASPNALSEAFRLSGEYIADQVMYGPWSAEASFTFDGNVFTISGGRESPA